jgi:hypothetical protein
MVAEVLTTYEAMGSVVSRPSKVSRRSFAPTFPMGRYVSQPLRVPCATLEDVRTFLASCSFMSDQDQFGRKDYWTPPEEFEERKRGDCDDFALWAWRQVMSLGYDARFVVGRSGLYGIGHAWVTFLRNHRVFLLESTAACLGAQIPRLDTLRYHPLVSVRWDGERIRYYEHEPTSFDVPLREVLPLVPEWTLYKVRFWTRAWWHRGRRALRSGGHG